MKSYTIYRNTLIQLLIEQYRAEKTCENFVYGKPVVTAFEGSLPLQGSDCYDLMLSIIGVEFDSSLYFTANEKFMDKVVHGNINNMQELIDAINVHLSWLEGEV